jgi:hypothetical protein
VERNGLKSFRNPFATPIEEDARFDEPSEAAKAFT